VSSCGPKPVTDDEWTRSISVEAGRDCLHPSATMRPIRIDRSRDGGSLRADAAEESPRRGTDLENSV
jgi:hypothetical protein